MADLDPEIRDLFEAARGTDEPTAEARLEVRNALVRKLGAAALAVPLAKATSVAAGHAASGTGAAGATGNAGGMAGASAQVSTIAAGTTGGAGAAAAGSALSGLGTTASMTSAAASAGSLAAGAKTLAAGVGAAKLWLVLAASGVAGVAAVQVADLGGPDEPSSAQVTTGTRSAGAVETRAQRDTRLPAPQLEPAVDASPEAASEALPSPLPPPTGGEGRQAPEASDGSGPVRAHRRRPPAKARARSARPARLKERPATPAADAPLSAELSLIRDAQAALRSGEPERALALAGAHASRFPEGAMTRERLAVSALAHCAMGEAPGEAARELQARFPSSPLVTRVQRACR